MSVRKPFMRARLAVSLSSIVLVSGSAWAQVPSSIPPQSAAAIPVASPAPTTHQTPADADATHEAFEENVAKQAEIDRKRDAQTTRLMRSMCVGCDPVAPQQNRAHAGTIAIRIRRLRSL